MDAEFSSTSSTPDNLLAEDAVAMPITLLSGESVVRGEVLGEVTTGGKFRASLAAETDGSEVPRAIAAEDMDASLADKAMHAYLEGKFNQDALTIGTGHSIASIKQDLWDFNIYILDPVTKTPV
jgi:hypothetical protein